MRFFDSAAASAFGTASDGRRLFYSFGPWSRPYIVPDAATEDRLADKQRAMIGVLIGLIVVVQLLMRGYDESIIRTWWGFLGYVGLVWLGYYVVQQIIFREELRGLTRAEARTPFHEYYAGMAARRSTGSLVLSLAMGLVFVAAGLWMVVGGAEPGFGLVLLVLYAFTDVTTAYALMVKLRPGAA
jgi:hypothetical protein